MPYNRCIFFPEVQVGSGHVEAEWDLPERSNLVAPIDASHPFASQVCWDTTNNKETVLYALGSTYGHWPSPRRGADASASMKQRP